MDGLPADVDGGKAGRCDDGEFGVGPVAERTQKGGFAGSGTAGHEQVAVTLADECERRREFLGRRDAVRPGRCGGWDYLRGCRQGRPSVSQDDDLM